MKYRIKEVRKKKGLTQKQLGDLLGISASAVSQFEADSANIQKDTLERIASALGCSIVDLIDKDAFDNASSSERIAVLNSAWSEASAQLSKADSIAKIAGYEWVILPDLEEIEEKTIYLSDKKTGTLYAVESDLFTDAIDGSTEFIKFKFEKLMKTAKVVTDGGKTEEGQERKSQDQ